MGMDDEDRNSDSTQSVGTADTTESATTATHHVEGEEGAEDEGMSTPGGTSLNLQGTRCTAAVDLHQGDPEDFETSSRAESDPQKEGTTEGVQDREGEDPSPIIDNQKQEDLRGESNENFSDGGNGSDDDGGDASVFSAAGVSEDADRNSDEEEEGTMLADDDHDRLFRDRGIRAEKREEGDNDHSNKPLSSTRPKPVPSPPPSVEVWVSSLTSPVAATVVERNGVDCDHGDPSHRRVLFGYGVRRLHARATSACRHSRNAQAPTFLSISDLYEVASRSLQSAAGLGMVIHAKGATSHNPAAGHELVCDFLRQWGTGASNLYGELSRLVRERSHQPVLSLSVVHADALTGMDQRWNLALSRCREEARKRLSLEAAPSSSSSPPSDQDPPRDETSLQGLVCRRLERMVLEQYLLLETDRVRTVGPCLRQFLADSRNAVAEGWPSAPSPSAVVGPPPPAVVSLSPPEQGPEGADEDPSSSFGGDDEDSNVGAGASSTSTADAMGAASAPPSPPQQQRRKKLFSKRRGKSGGGGGGVMDAETLGLPEEIGRLRDQVRAKISARSDRLQVIRVLAGFLENVAAAHAKLGGGLRQVNEDMRQPQPQSPTLASVFLASALPASFTEASGDLTEGESPALQKLWCDIITAVEVEGKSALALAAALRALRSDKLDRALLYGDKTIKTATELDDSLWKQLCDAARHQSRTEARYRQVSEQTAKMRERVKSQDSDPGSKLKKKEPSKVNKHVSKSIANMFSILPDGGAEALRIFAPGARATIAAHSLEEADSRETNRRQQLDAAVEATAKCVESYKKTATALVKQYDDDETEAWRDIRSVLDGIVSASEFYRTTRLSSLAEKEPFEQDFGYLEDYRTELQRKAGSLVSECSGGGDQELTQKLDGTPASEPSAGSRVEETANEERWNDGNSVSNASTPGMEASQPKAAGSSPDRPSSSVGDDREGDGPLHQKMALSPQKSVSSIGSEFLRLASYAIDSSPIRDPSNQLSLETEVFLSYFWQDSVDRSKVPQVVESFACSFRDGSKRSPSQYGRLFVTPTRIIFNSWTGRKLNVSWSELKDVERVSSTYDDSILLTTKKSEDEDLYSILGGLYDRTSLIELIARLRHEASISIRDSSAHVAPPLIPTLETALSVPIPPDETLKKMNVVLSRQLKSISVQRFYEIAWSEEEQPFYEPWLSRVCFDIKMGRWQLESAVGPWCGETYDQKRVITFKVKRRTHLYIGPPIANVMQTHYCRREGNDKCVLGMTVEFEGMPYSDTFRVEVRWVARREGTQDMQVDVGVFVDFQKSTILKSKIQAGTLEETAPVQRNLFEAIKAASLAAGGQGSEEVEEESAEVKREVDRAPPSSALTPNATPLVAIYMVVVLYLLRQAMVWWVTSTRVAESPESGNLLQLSRRMDALEVEIKAVRSTLQEALDLLKAQQVQQEL